MNLRTIRNTEYFLLGVFTLVFLYYAVQALVIGDTFRFMVVLIPSLAFSLLPLVFEYAFKVKLPPGVKAFISLALLVHVAGGINRFYWKFAPFYDKVAHVISALALFLLIICFFIVLDYWGKPMRWRTILISALVITSVLMVSWEISEYLIDVMARTSYNNGMADSIGDLISNVIGIVIGFLIALYYQRLVPAGKNPGCLLEV